MLKANIHICSKIARGKTALIKALIALVGRLPLGVCLEKGSELGLKTVSFNP